MKYTGRILLLLFTGLNYGAWLAYQGHTFGILTFTLFLASWLFQTVISWWLGWQYDKIRFYAHKDALTKTYNRRFINVKFPRLRMEAERNRKKLSVFLLDADKLKDINDQHGHKVGDHAIQHISRVLLNHIRKSDLVARWGGDEFLVIAPDCDLASAREFVKRIQNELTAEGVRGTEICVSASIGIAVYPDDGKTLNELIRLADQRMYKRKRGNNDAIF